MKYEKSYWDYGWLILGVIVSGYGVLVGTVELIWWGVPVMLLAYKCIMQSRYIQELEDDLEGGYDEEYAEPYVVSDSVDRKYANTGKQHR